MIVLAVFPCLTALVYKHNKYRFFWSILIFFSWFKLYFSTPFSITQHIFRVKGQKCTSNLTVVHFKVWFSTNHCHSVLKLLSTPLQKKFCKTVLNSLWVQVKTFQSFSTIPLGFYWFSWHASSNYVVFSTVSYCKNNKTRCILTLRSLYRNIFSFCHVLFSMKWYFETFINNCLCICIN